MNVQARLRRGAGAYAALMEAVETHGWGTLPKSIDALGASEAKDLVLLFVRARHLNLKERGDGR